MKMSIILLKLNSYLILDSYLMLGFSLIFGLFHSLVEDKTLKTCM